MSQKHKRNEEYTWPSKWSVLAAIAFILSFPTVVLVTNYFVDKPPVPATIQAVVKAPVAEKADEPLPAVVQPPKKCNCPAK